MKTKKNNLATPGQCASFRRRVWAYYRAHGRHTLPWRTISNPYHILVSEIMLQQTQVERVLPKYLAFIKTFPTVRTLARAPLSDVLKLWSGLGYNRRARMLHQAAQEVLENYGGRMPHTQKALEALPGVGPYTAAAVMAFAYNAPVVMIETNIRTVFLHEFFAHTESVSDADILPIIEKTLPRKRAREWYAALMDYGSHLKRVHGNPSRRSKHHAKQAAFKGSLREVRGAIMRELLQGSRTETQLERALDFSSERIKRALAGLQKDALIALRGKSWGLAA